MVEEKGIVVELKGTRAVIKAEQGAGCESCSSKKLCFPTEDGDDILIEADNALGAAIGDEVIFSVGAGTVIKAGVLFYLVPLLAFIAGVVLGQAYGGEFFPEYNRDLVSAVLGFGLLVVSFLWLRYYGKKVSTDENYRPTITRIV